MRNNLSAKQIEKYSRQIVLKNVGTIGQKKILISNVLILEIDSRGLLVKKDFFDIDDMQKIDFSDQETELIYSKRSFVYDFLSSLRQKANDPLGKRKRKREF